VLKINKKYVLLSLTVLLPLLFSPFIYSKDKEQRIIKSSNNKAFENGRIIQTKDSIYKGRDNYYKKKYENLTQKQENLEETIRSLNEKIDQISQKNLDNTSKKPASINSNKEKEEEEVSFTDTQINLTPEEVSRPIKTNKIMRTRVDKNSGMIVFPVERTKEKKTGLNLDLPSGSYAKAKIIAGAQVPDGRTIPFLLQLDEVYILPNNKWIDLSGCFIIAKGEADLSTERLEMQPNSLSCVSKSNKLFEANLSGWVVDERDNNFALDAKLISKRGRVARTAFASSLVTGISRAIQQAQTDQSRTPLGGDNTIITGSQAKYIGAGAVGESASLVTQWYLEQARNLLPTLKVSSGRDVWVVLSEKVEIPISFINELNRKKKRKLVFREKL
jgi:hypothetical protein